MMSQAVEAKREKQGKGKTAKLREAALSTGSQSLPGSPAAQLKPYAKSSVQNNTLMASNGRLLHYLQLDN